MHNYVTIQPNSSSKERAGIIDEDRSDREGVDTLKRHPAKFFVVALSLVLLLCGLWTTFRGHTLQPATFKSQENILENVAQVPRKVLVTGFLPFLNFASNPTGQVATLLNGTCHVIDNGGHPDVCFTGLVVDVSTEGAKEAVREAHSLDSDYSLVLHLGFESDAKGLKLEAVAANVLGSIENPEWSSTTAKNPFRLTAGPIDSDSPWLLPTTAPLSCAWFALFQEYTRSSHARNVSTLWSRDAGAYYCNELYFRSLGAGWEREREKDSPSLKSVLFVHLPPTSLVALNELAVIVQDIAAAITRCL